MIFSVMQVWKVNPASWSNKNGKKRKGIYNQSAVRLIYKNHGVNKMKTDNSKKKKEKSRGGKKNDIKRD